ncbi:MAG: HAD hydrolase-like protein, partial [Chlamydiia bacterium]|nr:HAD hydrolase-like protein [Chlamydiia bacterium]
MFDTLVWRKVPKPEDLFLILGKCFKEEGWLRPGLTPEGFALLRAAADKTARYEKEYCLHMSEVTLTEIYWRMHSLFNPLTVEEMLADKKKGVFSSDVAPLVQREVAIEKKLMNFEDGIVQLISYAGEQGIPVVLVSDTYFEEQEITEFLGTLTSKFSTFYLSCVYGVSKRKGLFRALLRERTIDPQRILHIGDHPAADFHAARREGIRALHYPKREAKLDEVIEWEWSESLEKRAQLLDSEEGDFGMSAARSKILYHKELSYLPKEERFFWKYGASILGPILLGFIQWIYERTHEMGEGEVFCLMREGDLYIELIKRYAPYYPQHRLKATPLWVSRLFINHASLSSANGNELFLLMKAFLAHFTVE